ncbi:MAG TPA: carbohydrate ABC transporter permease [Campylobacterales bacterium]|nr:carbohydrate ABC transporter permease [Campylobacterales bacterium]
MKRSLKIFYIHLVPLLWAIFSIFPFLTMLFIALKPKDVFMSFPPKYFSSRLTFDNFAVVLKDPNWLRYYGNTIFIATIVSIIAVIIGSLAAYSFARYAFKGKKFLMVFILALQMIPPASIIIPLYNMFANLNLLDTYSVLIFVNSVSVMPLIIWLMNGYFLTIPTELEEAAFIDGASKMKAFWLVTFPIAAPGIAASLVYAFIRAFNEYIIARTLAGSRVVTYTVGLTTFTNQYEGIDMTLVSAASFTALIPIIVMFAIFHKYFIIGFTGGAIKG